MTDETTNLVLEHRRAIRTDIAGVTDEIRGVRAEQTATRRDLRAQSTRIEQLMEDAATIKVRLDRIEARLGLTEMAK